MRIFVALFFFFPLLSYADCTMHLQVEGAIGPATLDYLERAQEKAALHKCASMYVEINTPGGNLQTTRTIVEKIMASPIPFLCLVTPSGGHAGSAGAIILQACHVNGAMEATNIGAATPISSFGEDIYKDLRKKMIEDTQSWVEGLAAFYGRNQKLAGQLVSEAKAVDARTAAEQKLIDQVVYKADDFLTFANNRTAKMQKGAEEAVKVYGLIHFAPDLRYKTLDLFTDPQWSYIMFMGSLGLLYFEITHPGMILPGVVGGMGLIISMISFQKLDVYWGGLALILLGISLLIAELFVTSFGALGLGGAVSLVIGSILLFDFEKTGIHLPLSLILTVSTVLFSLVLGLSMIALRTMRMPRNKGGGSASLLGEKALITQLENEHDRTGWLRVQGEIWKFESPVSVKIGDAVRIEKVQGLVVIVKPLSEESKNV